VHTFYMYFVTLLSASADICVEHDMDLKVVTEQISLYSRQSLLHHSSQLPVSGPVLKHTSVCRARPPLNTGVKYQLSLCWLMPAEYSPIAICLMCRETTCIITSTRQWERRELDRKGERR
jgi:hypothetical protein